jgi:hypothetical protein
VSVFGGARVGVRIGPGGTWNGMSDSNTEALFTYVAHRLSQFGLAYLHIIEPRVKETLSFARGRGRLLQNNCARCLRERSSLQVALSLLRQKQPSAAALQMR